MKKFLGVVPAAAVLAFGLAPANAASSESAPAAPETSAAAIEKAMARAKDPNSVLLERLSTEDRELLKSSKVKSVLIDASTGAVLSVGEGDFVPEGAAPGSLEAKWGTAAY